MYRLLPLIIVVALIVGGFLLWKFIAPWWRLRVDRARRKEEFLHQMEKEQHDWELQNVKTVREDLARHRARLEGNLDELHRDINRTE